VHVDNQPHSPADLRLLTRHGPIKFLAETLTVSLQKRRTASSIAIGEAGNRPPFTLLGRSWRRCLERPFDKSRQILLNQP
jgi:hypothetical protein